MKDIILENPTLLTGGFTGSLPEFINLNQYRAYDLENGKNDIVGSLEHGEFDFQIDPGENDGFLINIKKWIFETGKRNITKISRAELLNKYIIFEIPDYGYMSMSTYYRDFVPQVYLNGQKVWQSYISVLKYYTAKKAYILVMKNINGNPNNFETNLSNLSEKDENGKTPVKIRIIYKNAKEDYNIVAEKYNIHSASSPHVDNETRTIFLERTDSSPNLYKLEDISLIFDGQLVGDVISDYDYFDNNGNEINKELIKSVKITETNINIYEQKNYFRQTFDIDISLNDPKLSENSDFERKVKANIELETKINLSTDNITLKSKYNNKKAYYYKKKDISSYLNNINYEVFNKEGRRVINTDDDTDETNIYEIIPEYSSKRKIILENSETTLEDTLKKYVPIYRSNLKDGEVLVYTNGLFKDNKQTDITKGSILILYDNNEEENKNVLEYLNNNNSNFKGTAFKINRDSNNILEKPNPINGSSNEIHQYTPYGTNRPTTSFILKLKKETDTNNTETVVALNNPKAYLICRCFPIPLDYYYLTPDMIYYKLPDYFYAPKNLYNKTEINGEYKTETGTSINRFILDALDPTIYFESDIKGCTFIDIDNTNEDIYEKDNIDNLEKIKSPYLGNTHIINYNRAALNNRQQ